MGAPDLYSNSPLSLDLAGPRAYDHIRSMSRLGVALTLHVCLVSWDGPKLAILHSNRKVRGVGFTSHS